MGIQLIEPGLIVEVDQAFLVVLVFGVEEATAVLPPPVKLLALEA